MRAQYSQTTNESCPCDLLLRDGGELVHAGVDEEALEAGHPELYHPSQVRGITWPVALRDYLP